MDFAIGNEDYLYKRLAKPTLEQFTNYYHTVVDTSVDNFFGDPERSNTRAIHVYKKAGFRLRGKYQATEGYFRGQKSVIMINKL